MAMRLKLVAANVSNAQIPVVRRPTWRLGDIAHFAAVRGRSPYGRTPPEGKGPSLTAIGPSGSRAILESKRRDFRKPPGLLQRIENGP
jgi:hypothetical protein